jgi:hypothetical protein
MVRIALGLETLLHVVVDNIHFSFWTISKISDHEALNRR